MQRKRLQHRSMTCTLVSIDSVGEQTDVTVLQSQQVDSTGPDFVSAFISPCLLFALSFVCNHLFIYLFFNRYVIQKVTQYNTVAACYKYLC